jgi:hypothetical protein
VKEQFRGTLLSRLNLKARLSEYDDWFRFFDEKLKPIATCPIRTSEDLEEFKHRHPLDMAGIRTEAENVLAAMIELYASTPKARQPIRDLFARYRSANWALWPPQRPTSEDGFRKWLLRISTDDKGDSRDAMVMLGGIAVKQWPRA